MYKLILILTLILTVVAIETTRSYDLEPGEKIAVEVVGKNSTLFTNDTIHIEFYEVTMYNGVVIQRFISSKFYKPGNHTLLSNVDFFHATATKQSNFVIHSDQNIKPISSSWNSFYILAIVLLTGVCFLMLCCYAMIPRKYPVSEELTPLYFRQS